MDLLTFRYSFSYPTSFPLQYTFRQLQLHLIQTIPCSTMARIPGNVILAFPLCRPAIHRILYQILFRLANILNLSAMALLLALPQLTTPDLNPPYRFEPIRYLER